MVLGISRRKARLWKENFTFTHSPLDLFYPSTYPPLLWGQSALKILKENAFKLLPKNFHSQHSMSGCSLNEKETHGCLLTQIFPPTWFKSYLIAGSRTGSRVIASEGAVSCSVLRLSDEVALLHATGKWPCVCNTQHIHLGDKWLWCMVPHMGDLWSHPHLPLSSPNILFLP